MSAEEMDSFRKIEKLQAQSNLPIEQAQIILTHISDLVPADFNSVDDFLTLPKFPDAFSVISTYILDSSGSVDLPSDDESVRTIEWQDANTNISAGLIVKYDRSGKYRSPESVEVHARNESERKNLLSYKFVYQDSSDNESGLYHQAGEMHARFGDLFDPDEALVSFFPRSPALGIPQEKNLLEATRGDDTLPESEGYQLLARAIKDSCTILSSRCTAIKDLESNRG